MPRVYGTKRCLYRPCAQHRVWGRKGGCTGRSQLCAGSVNSSQRRNCDLPAINNHCSELPNAGGRALSAHGHCGKLPNAGDRAMSAFAGDSLPADSRCGKLPYECRLLSAVGGSGDLPTTDQSGHVSAGNRCYLSPTDSIGLSATDSIGLPATDVAWWMRRTLGCGWLSLDAGGLQSWNGSYQSWQTCTGSRQHPTPQSETEGLAGRWNGNGLERWATA